MSDLYEHLRAEEHAELQRIMRDLGLTDMADWFAGAVAREVAWSLESARHVIEPDSFPRPRPKPGLDGFARAADKAEKWWQDMGPAARREVGLRLSEAALAGDQANGPAGEVDRLFGTLDTDAEEIVSAILARLKAAAEATPPELQVPSRRQVRVSLAENVIMILWHETRTRRTDPRGAYRRAVNVALLALDRAADWPAGPGGEASRRGWTRGSADLDAGLPVAASLDDTLSEAYRQQQIPPG